MLLIFFSLFLSFIFPIVNILGDTSEYYQTEQEFDILMLPDVDFDREQRDNRRFQYGHKFDVDYGIKNSGTWETLDMVI